MKNTNHQIPYLFFSIISTLAAVVIVNKLHIPNPNIILLIVVTFFTFSGGFLCGIPSGIIIIIYSFVFFSGYRISFFPIFHYCTQESKQKLIIICIFIPVMILMVGYLKRKVELKSDELLSANKQLRLLSEQDALTGLPNRRSLNKIYNEYILSAHAGNIISFVIIDIDFFKQYNDTYGHLRGDTCLKKVAKAIENTIEQTGDFAARCGGEEFCLFLPNTDRNSARIVCDRIIEAVRTLKIRHKTSSVSRFLTVSIGIATATVKPNYNPVLLAKKADKALYQAKNNGRNRIEIYSTGKNCAKSTI